MATERIAVSEVESVIRQLRDVLGARVVSDSSTGMIQEIHILSGGARPPKQLVRDVESALQARLGIALDHKKVSIAQVQETGTRETTARIQFADVSIALSGQSSEAKVRLTRDADEFTGLAAGAANTAGQIRVVADATLKAVQGLLPNQPIMLIEDAVTTAVGPPGADGGCRDGRQPVRRGAVRLVPGASGYSKGYRLCHAGRGEPTGFSP